MRPARVQSNIGVLHLLYTSQRRARTFVHELGSSNTLRIRRTVGKLVGARVEVDIDVDVDIN